jgi:hypothetical protein
VLLRRRGYSSQALAILESSYFFHAPEPVVEVKREAETAVTLADAQRHEVDAQALWAQMCQNPGKHPGHARANSLGHYPAEESSFGSITDDDEEVEDDSGAIAARAPTPPLHRSRALWVHVR